MSWMALGWHVGDHEWERNLDFGAWGGGKEEG